MHFGFLDAYRKFDENVFFFQLNVIKKKFKFHRTKKKADDNESADSYDDLSDSEDDDESNAGLANRIPASHEVAMVHGTRSVLALASDPSGARLASGSIDSR